MQYSELNTILSVAVSTAHDAGSYIKEHTANLHDVKCDLLRDVKVEADAKIEEFIVESLLRQSDFPIISEESGLHQNKSSDDGYRWIVDPLDGSFNFSKSIPLCCISIGFWRDMEPVLGVVYDFNRNETFTGIANDGAWLNGMAIKVGEANELAKAVLCTGFPVSTCFSTEALLSFVENIRDFKKVRLFGSAALSLAYVACGRADYYKENDIKLWDVAAGLALVKSAGGSIKYTMPSTENTLNVDASNEFLLQ